MTESVCTGLSRYACGVLSLGVNVQLRSMGDPRAHQHEKGSSSLEGWREECRDKASQPGALTSGVGASTSVCSNHWNGDVKELRLGTLPGADVCPL